MNLFTHKINDLDSWSKVFQDIDAWQSLVIYIFQKENLPFSEIELLTPGTNAVFKIGNYVIKIFVPIEVGLKIGTDYVTELFGIKYANVLSISTPKLIASGIINDKYDFQYIITEFINAVSFGDIEGRLSYDEKVIIGRKLRKITDKINTACNDFKHIDVIENALKKGGWHDYPESFKIERLSYIANIQINENERVYCHGDLNPANILVDDNLDLYIIDFADAMYAPIGYEHALIACELFCFERPYMIGYFGNYSVDVIVDLCERWLPLHDSGEHTLRCNIGPAIEITSFSVMRKRLYEFIKAEKERVMNADVIFHYDSLIDENNDPARDSVLLKEYMKKWDGDNFLEAMQLTLDKSVLEIGIGTGRLALRVCGKCGNFTGIDISPKTIKRAKENLQGFLNIHLICGDFLTYHFSRIFDVVYSSLTFLHIKDKKSAIQRVVNILESNGRFVLSLDKNKNTVQEFGNRRIEIYPDTPGEIISLLIKAGMVIERQFETEFAYIIVAIKGA